MRKSGPARAWLSAIALVALACPRAMAQSTQVEDDVVWCALNSSANRTLLTQPPDLLQCNGWRVAGALAAKFSGRPDLAAIALNQTQHQLGAKAVELACQGNPVSDQLAVRLLTVCQCHNPGAARRIDSNQDMVIASLLSIGNDRKDLYPGSCVPQKTASEIKELRKHVTN